MFVYFLEHNWLVGCSVVNKPTKWLKETNYSQTIAREWGKLIDDMQKKKKSCFIKKIQSLLTLNIN